jgi:hypothetical protein
MIHQNDPDMLPDIQKEGCAYCALAYFGEKYQNQPWTAQALNSIWNIAKHNGIIDSTNTITNWQALCNLLGLHLKYVDGHFSIDSAKAQGCYTICAWYNPNTKFTHFVVGTSKPVEYDPIKSDIGPLYGSKTVREGYPKKEDGLRIFQILA